MFPFNKYPYTNFHNLNLDWIINEVKNLKTRVDNIIRNEEIKKGNRYDYVMCVGDSYTVGPGAVSGKGWPDRLYPIIGAVRSYTLWNGGGGFARSGYNGTMAQAVRAADIPDADKVTLVICMAGINDGNDDSSLKTGATDFIKAVREKCGNAEIIGFASAAPVVIERSRYVSIGQAFTVNGCQFVNSWNWCLSANDYYKSAEDNIHLNDNGYTHVACKIAATLLGGNYEGIRNTATASANGVTVSISSDDYGLSISANGKLTSYLGSAAIAVLGIGAKPLRKVTISGACGSIVNPDFTTPVTYQQSIYLTPAGELAFPGSNLQNCTLSMENVKIPWDALH